MLSRKVFSKFNAKLIQSGVIFGETESNIVLEVSLVALAIEGRVWNGSNFVLFAQPSNDFGILEF